MTGKAIKQSLRTRILLSATIGLTILLVIMGTQRAKIVATFTSYQLTDWKNTTMHSAKHLQSHIQKDQILLEQLATELAHLAQEHPESDASVFMDKIRERLTIFPDGIIWLDPAGEVVAWVPEQQPVETLLPTVLSSVLPFTTDDHRLSDLLHTAAGRLIVTSSFQMDQLGFLLAVADLEEANFIAGFLPQTAKGGHSALIDSQGWVLSSAKDVIRFTRREHPEWVNRVMQEGLPTVVETNGNNSNDQHIMAFAPIGDTGWGLVMGEPRKEALAATIELRRNLMLLGLSALALVIGYTWWGTGSVIRPLQRLTSQAENIAAGDLNARVEIKRTDEIGSLAHAFEVMRVSLHNSREKLENALAETRRREKEVVTLYTVTQEILRSTDNKSALQTVVERTGELTGGNAVAICLAESPDGLLQCVATASQEKDIPPATGHPCVAPHQSQAAQPCPIPRLNEPRGKVLAEEIARENAARGFLCVAVSPGQTISQQDHTLLAGLANLAGLALLHERLHAQSRTLAVYEERERISRELHDNVSQSLSYLYSQLELLQELLPQLSTEQLHAELSALAEVASVAFEEARDSIFSLRLSRSSGDPLPTLIIGCVRDFKARTGITVELETDVMAKISLTPEAEIQLVHVVQEALSNVAKHSRCTKVAVQAKMQEGELEITIQDNGDGFDPAAPRPGRRSFGLEMMRERIKSVNGSLEIQSNKGSGTCVQVRIPLEKI